MSNKTNQNQNQPLPAMEPTPEFHVPAAIAAKATAYEIPEGTALEKLAVIAAIRRDIEAAENAGFDSRQEATAHDALVATKRDYGVLAVAELLASVPARVVQAALHKEYGGKSVAGKVSKTIPDGDGEAFLKAAKAYRDVCDYCDKGIIPESWSRGTSQRGEIAALLEPVDRAALAVAVSEGAKIRVSDTVTRFFRDFTPKAAPTWANPDKLQEIAENILVNADYVREYPELRAAYLSVLAAFNEATKD